MGDAPSRHGLQFCAWGGRKHPGASHKEPPPGTDTRPGYRDESEEVQGLHTTAPPAIATATRVRKLHNATFTCPFCGGSGHLPHYRHVQNGDCFACGATGQLRDVNAFIGGNSDLMLTVWLHRGAFHGATLRRRTWKMTRCTIGSGADQRIGMGKTWGRDAFVREINDAEEAREIWRDAKHLGILTELMD